MNTDKSMQAAQSDNPESEMTGEQRSVLQALCAETGAHFEDELTQAEAAELIGELKTLSPRLQRP
jgi:hypothetical protein